MKYLLVALLVMLAACQTVVPDSQTDMQSFSSVDELRAMLTSQGTSDGMFMGATNRAMMMESAPASQGLDTSETNVQVAGIDEADIVKVHQDLVYTVSENTLFIIRAYPGEDAQVLSRTQLEHNPIGLFIEDDVLVVIASSWRGYGDIMPMGRMIWPGPSSQTTHITTYSVNQDHSLSERDAFEFEGGYVDARLKDGTAYVVINSQVTSSHPIPIIMRNGQEQDFAVDRIAFFPRPYSEPQLTSIHAITLGNGQIDSQGVLTEYANTVYMSHEALYIASGIYINEWTIRQDQLVSIVETRLSAEERNLIRRIDLVDDDIMSAAEKRQRKLQVMHEHISSLSREEQRSVEDEIEQATQEELDKHTYRDYTRIAKVSLEPLRVVASQEIVGTVNNQFSLDEHDGVLRVATTTQQIWDKGHTTRPSENHVFTLDSSLRVLDHLDGIAPTERIFSARYVGDRLYLVTFEIIDPFFVIDLSNPNNIEILGELKIEGFSRYLHPYDENTIIGFGRDADARGVQQGLKISLFDVSDVTQPQEIASWIGDSRSASSAAEFEHKAFLFDKERNLLVLPAYSYDWRTDSETYNGALVFDISSTNIELRGLIDHAQGQRWGTGVERSFYIEELLYTKSPTLLRINQLEDLGSVRNVTLTPLSKTDIPLY